MDTDSDIDIDDDEILHLQQKMYQRAPSTPPRNTVLKKIAVKDVVYSDGCERVVDRYKKSGLEINAFLRGGGGDASELGKIIFKLDQCFKKVEDLFPSGGGNYIKTWRSMSNSFDPSLTMGYTSTSNQFVGMSSRYLYTIYIPCDARVLVIDISRETGKADTFEVVLERRVQLIHLGGDVFVVDTPFARAHLKLFDNLI